MICATGMLPLIGAGLTWYGKRIVEQGDRLISDVAELKTQERLNMQAIDFVKETGEGERQNVRSILTTFDARLRGLELEARALPPRR